MHEYARFSELSRHGLRCWEHRQTGLVSNRILLSDSYYIACARRTSNMSRLGKWMLASRIFRGSRGFLAVDAFCPLVTTLTTFRGRFVTLDSPLLACLATESGFVVRAART